MSKPRAASAPAAHGGARARKRTASPSLFRRIAAAATALVLGAGLALVGVAAPASAHTGDLKASAVCNTATGEYDVTYTLKLTNVPSNKTGTTKWRVGDTDFDGTPNSAANMDRGPISTKGNGTIELDTEHLSGDTQGYGPWVYAYTTWSGADKGSDGRLTTRLAGDCSKPETPDQVCPPLDTGHLTADNKKTLLITAPEGKLIAEVCVKAGSVNNGGGPELTTVNPPSKTYTISHSTGKDISHYSVRYVDAPKSVAIPAKPAMLDECGVGQDAIAAPPQIDGVTWNIGVVVDGEATATATTTSGHIFADGTTSKSWDFTFTNEPCPIAAPVAPTFIEQCGLAGDAVVLPADVEHVTWNIVGDPKAGGIVTVTAVADAGYAFPADAKTVFTHTFTDVPCPPTIIAIVGAPTETDVCEPDGDKVVLPPATEHMTWVVAGDPKLGGIVTVTAVADEGFAFAKDAKTTFEFTFDSEPCPTEVAVPAAPAAVDLCGVDGDKVTLPADSERFTWATDDAADRVVVVTVTTKEGFVFPNGKHTASFTFGFDDRECIEPRLKVAVATGECVADAPWIFYDIELSDPDKQSTGNTARLVLTDGTNTETIVLGELDGGKLKNKILWPGASVAADGVTPTGWPGWELVGTTWVQVDDNFAWTRGDIQATIEVNPEATVDLSYPPATPECAVGPKGSGSGSAAAGTGLASTGFEGTAIGIVAGIIVVAGIAFLVIARIRRNRA